MVMDLGDIPKVAHPSLEYKATLIFQCYVVTPGRLLSDFTLPLLFFQ